MLTSVLRTFMYGTIFKVYKHVCKIYNGFSVFWVDWSTERAISYAGLDD